MGKNSFVLIKDDVHIASAFTNFGGLDSIGEDFAALTRIKTSSEAGLKVLKFLVNILVMLVYLTFIPPHEVIGITGNL